MRLKAESCLQRTDRKYQARGLGWNSYYPNITRSLSVPSSILEGMPVSCNEPKLASTSTESCIALHGYVSSGPKTAQSN